MSLPFWKLSATGNDFVVIDHREPRLQERLLPEFVSRVCARHTGVGADGLLLLESDEQADFRMRYWNADGSQATMCGNGARALAWLARELRLWDQAGTFMADDGLHRALDREGTLGVSLNVKAEGRQIQLNGTHSGWQINTGVPHLVIFTEQVADEPVVELGRKYRFDPRFQPEGTNVNFVEADEHSLRVRTYERGVENETLACGTGVLAAAAIACDTLQLPFPLTVEVAGGTLRVSRQEHEWILWGPVDRIYTGDLLLNGEIHRYLFS